MCEEENEYGTCGCCGKEASLQRTTFEYPGVKCECHGPHHFVMYHHCSECNPKEPTYSAVEFKTENLKNPAAIAIPMLQYALTEGGKGPESYYDSWHSSIFMAICDIMGPMPIDADIHDIASRAATLFLDRLIAGEDSL
jgi:hypothetical protein